MSQPYYQDDTITLHLGDCRDVLRTLPDASVDAVVTDPPYELGFMGKTWDASGIAYSVDLWREMLRVLKPGGHLLSFGATRTAHRMACAVEDAGFEIRDTITWHYASGFPKSLDVSKAIDKTRDDKADVCRVTTWLKAAAESAGVSRRDVDAHLGTSDMGGWFLTEHPTRCACPTWEQWESLRGLIGFGDEMDAESWRLNGRKGTPGEAWGQREVIEVRPDRRGDGTVIGLSHSGEIARATSDAARQWTGWGTALKPASEPIIVARKPLARTVAASVLTYGTGALNVDACRVATEDALHTSTVPNNMRGGAYGSGHRPDGDQEPFVQHQAGRWPANAVFVHAETCVEGGTCAEGCPVAELDAQTAGLKRQGNLTYGVQDRTGASSQVPNASRLPSCGYDDSGGASRFFPTFRYQAKADAAERPRLAGVAHPTVKPLDLMRWLVRLVTPPGGLVLDPFAGSGTTAEACVLERFRCLSIERDATYTPLIVDRVTGHRNVVEQLTRRAAAGEDADLGLFAFLDGGAA